MKKGQPRSATVTMFPARLRLNRVVLMILPVAGASLFLYMPVIHWLLKKMSASNGALHGFSLIIIGGVGLYRLSLKKTAGLRQPTLYHPGLLIWFPASIIYLYNEAYIGFHTLSAALFIVHLYGLAGHFLYRQQWQFMFLPLLLMILVLPFEHYLDVYLGFPLRLLSAQLAASLLQVADLPMLTSESILMIDNRVAMIDLDCSGIKSLWVGLIFYLLLTWIERFKVNSAWLATGLAFGLLLVFGNIFRIVILVTLELVLEFTQAARLLHQPLGLLSFALSCLVVWMVLIRFGDKTRVGTENRSQDPHQPETGRSLSCAVVITGILLLLIFCYRPLQTAVAAPDPHLLELPPQFGLRGASLGETEKNIYQNNRARAEKYQLSIPAENGRKRVEASMVLVWSRAWKSQHVPDNCYISQGYSIIDKQLRKSDRDHIQRYLQLLPTRNSTESQRPMTAVYWFQSVSGSTPDYSARVVDGLFHPNRQWVMASILFRETVEPDGVKSMIILIRQQLAQALAKTDQPSIPARSHSNET